MNEYKITYMASPISEIPKVKTVSAADETSAMRVFELSVGVYDLVSIEVDD